MSTTHEKTTLKRILDEMSCVSTDNGLEVLRFAAL